MKIAEDKICCVCGKKATKAHYSIIGGIPFPACEYHYKITGSMIGWCDKTKCNRAGLSMNGEFIDMPYLGEVKL